jgi:CBS-domain-containing membrane protein
MRSLTVADMMTTSLKTIYEDESISAADWDMVVGELRHLPVIDRERRLVGLVSDRDLLRATVQPASVASVMTREVRTIGPDAPAIVAVEHLLQYKHSALPVVDAHRVLLGIVTSTDFLELARRALSGLDIHQPHVRA